MGRKKMTVFYQVKNCHLLLVLLHYFVYQLHFFFVIGIFFEILITMTFTVSGIRARAAGTVSAEINRCCNYQYKYNYQGND